MLLRFRWRITRRRFFKSAGSDSGEEYGFHVIGPANPAHAGQTVSLFANGLDR